MSVRGFHNVPCHATPTTTNAVDAPGFFRLACLHALVGDTRLLQCANRIARGIQVVLVWILLFGMPVDSYAQEALVLSKGHPARFVTLANPAVVVVDDPLQNLTLDQVRLRAGNSAAPADAATIGTCRVCWVRLNITSALAADTAYAVLPFGLSDSIDLYVIGADGVVSSLGQTGVLAHARDTSEGRFASFTLKRGETVTLIARFTADNAFSNLDRNILLEPYAQSLQDDEVSIFFGGLVFGGLLVLGCYNLLVAITTRDRSYFWYCCYLGFMLFSFLGTDDTYHLILTPTMPKLGYWISHTADFLMWICLMMFVRAFLETRRNRPKVDKLCLAVIAIQIAGWVAGALSLPNFLKFNYAGFMLPTVVAVTAGIARLCQGFRPARYFLIAGALLAVGDVLQVGQFWDSDLLDFLPDSNVVQYCKDHALWMASMLEATVFSLALANRMKNLQLEITEQALASMRERERLVLDQRRQLEVEVAARTEELFEEKTKSDQLLQNILPLEVADELKATGVSRPRRYEDVTVMFTDFKGFTSTVSTLPAQRLVQELNEIFMAFDDILDEAGVEKIKTIGDSYMIVAGLPKEVPDHAQRCVAAALKMQAFVDTRNKTSSIKWQMRVGVHSGSVIAGIVGKRKFAYDVFGDTVNIASRLESAGEPGRINVSAYTFDLVKQAYHGEYRGKLDAKGKGEIDMYFIDASIVAA